MNANDCIHWSDDGHLLVSSEGGQRGVQDSGALADRDLGSEDPDERR